jgi:hypothetical protein
VNEAKELAKIIGTMIKNKQSNIKEDIPSRTKSALAAQRSRLLLL